MSAQMILFYFYFLKWIHFSNTSLQFQLSLLVDCYLHILIQCSLSIFELSLGISIYLIWILNHMLFIFSWFLPYLNKKKHRISLEFFILCLAWGENSWENNFSIIIKKNMWNNNFFLKLYSIENFFVRRTIRKGF